mgnify:CR=1 FL=1
MDQSAFNYNDYNYDGNSNPLTGLNGVDVNVTSGTSVVFATNVPQNYS